MQEPPLVEPLGVHWLLTQHWSAPQAFPQAPQLSWSLSSQTQAFPQTAPSQGLQTPPTQVPFLPAQTLPQAPQFSLSAIRSAH